MPSVVTVHEVLEDNQTKYIGTPLTATSSLDKDVKGEFVETASGEYDGSDLLPAVDEKPRLIDVLFRRKRLQTLDPDAIATRRSVFDDPVLAKHYWPTDRYENLHRFDVGARWTVREERVRTISLLRVLEFTQALQAIVRKLDWRVMLWAAISFSAVSSHHLVVPHHEISS